MKSAPQVLGEYIRLLRHRRRLTLEQMAERSQLSVTYVGEVERGLKEPSVTTLMKLSNALEVTFAQLVMPIDLLTAGTLTKFELLGRLEKVMKEVYSREEAERLVRVVSEGRELSRVADSTVDAGSNKPTSYL
jgi:transcriptional regulator with XRE-family HTH domain